MYVLVARVHIQRLSRENMSRRCHIDRNSSWSPMESPTGKCCRCCHRSCSCELLLKVEHRGRQKRAGAEGILGENFSSSDSLMFTWNAGELIRFDGDNGMVRPHCLNFPNWEPLVRTVFKYLFKDDWWTSTGSPWGVGHVHRFLIVLFYDERHPPQPSTDMHSPHLRQNFQRHHLPRWAWDCLPHWKVQRRTFLVEFKQNLINEKVKVTSSQYNFHTLH